MVWKWCAYGVEIMPGVDIPESCCTAYNLDRGTLLYWVQGVVYLLTVQPITHHQCCIGIHGVWGLHFSLLAIFTYGRESLTWGGGGRGLAFIVKSTAQTIQVLVLLSPS